MEKRVESAASAAMKQGAAKEPDFKSKFPPLSTPLERTQKNYESANQWQARITRIKQYEESTKNAREKEKEKWNANKLVAKELTKKEQNNISELERQRALSTNNNASRTSANQSRNRSQRPIGPSQWKNFKPLSEK